MNSGSYTPKFKYLPKLMPHLKPIYDLLSNPVDLTRCLPRLTTNANESFNAEIWRRFPKTAFASVSCLRVSLYDAILCRNSSYMSGAAHLGSLGFVLGRNTKKSLLNLDDLREQRREKSKPTDFEAEKDSSED